MALVEGAVQHNGLCPGYEFNKETDPLSGNADKTYIVRSVIHQGASGTDRAGAPAEMYVNTFICFPKNRAWREVLTVRRPRMYGIFSAVVIGTKNVEINSDPDTRIRAHFPWDRRGGSTPEGSVWLRLVQTWAGAGWGVQFIPRVGTEVAVALMDGGVDRPMAVGGMHNADYMPPFTVTGGSTTLSGIKTCSTPMPKDANDDPTGKSRAAGKALERLQ